MNLTSVAVLDDVSVCLVETSFSIKMMDGEHRYFRLFTYWVLKLLIAICSGRLLFFYNQNGFLCSL